MRPPLLREGRCRHRWGSRSDGGGARAACGVRMLFDADLPRRGSQRDDAGVSATHEVTLSTITDRDGEKRCQSMGTAAQATSSLLVDVGGSWDAVSPGTSRRH